MFGFGFSNRDDSNDDEENNEDTTVEGEGLEALFEVPPVDNGDDYAAFDESSVKQYEFAVAIRGTGQYVGTYLTGRPNDAVKIAFRENKELGDDAEVTVTKVADGTTSYVYVSDVVDTTPDEPWARGAGQRFSNLEHTDPDKVDEVLDNLREQTEDVDGLGNLVEEIENTADSLNDRDFECPTCGLSHGHSIEKHDVRDIFGVTDLFVNAVMEFNPLCHCGLHELDRLVDNYTGDVQIFEDGKPSAEKRESISEAAGNAPVPDSVLRKLDERFGV